MTTHLLKDAPEVIKGVNALAKFVGKSKRTIHTWKAEGKLPFGKVGGSVRFKRDLVIQALQAQSPGEI